MSHGPTKRSDGRIDYAECSINTEIDFTGSPDPRHRAMAPGASSNYDRGEDSILNPFDVYPAGQVVADFEQTKPPGGAANTIDRY